VEGVSQESAGGAVGFYEIVDRAGVCEIAPHSAGAKELSSGCGVGFGDCGLCAVFCGGDSGHQACGACTYNTHLGFHKFDSAPGRLDDFGSALGYSSQEFCTIRFVDYTRIEDDDNAFVSFVSDEPSETLLELQYSRWKLVIEEWVSAVLFNLFEPAGEQRLVGYGKREAYNYDAGEGLAGYVDALPEAVGAEKDTRVWSLELLQEGSSVETGPLLEQFDIVFCEPLGERVGQVIEHGVAGEEHEGPSVCSEEVFFERFGGGGYKGFFVWVGEAFFDIESDLLGVVEWRAELEGVEIFESDSAGEEVESLMLVERGAAQGCACEDDGLVTVEEALFDVGTDVECGASESRGGFSVCFFDPVNVVLLFLKEEVFEVGDDGGAPVGVSEDLEFLVEVFGFFGEG